MELLTDDEYSARRQRLVKILIEADTKILDEIIREAECYLEAQRSLSIAADQRATSFATILGATITLLGGGSFAFLIGDSTYHAVGLAGIIVVLLMLRPMYLAITSAGPTNFWVAGSSPADWDETITRHVAFKEALAEQAAHYANNISRNAKVLDSNALLMESAITGLWEAVFFGVMAAILLLVLHVI